MSMIGNSTGAALYLGGGCVAPALMDAPHAAGGWFATGLLVFLASAFVGVLGTDFDQEKDVAFASMVLSFTLLVGGCVLGAVSALVW